MGLMMTETMDRTAAANVPAGEALPTVRAEAGPSEAPAGGGRPAFWTLRSLFRTYRWRILFTYGLFNLENLLRLAQPLVLGLAIDGLLSGSYLGVSLFLAQHVAYTAISAGRRM